MQEEYYTMNSFSGRLTGQPDFRQTKPDIRPDTGYQKRPDIQCNPIKQYTFLCNLYLGYVVMSLQPFSEPEKKDNL